MMMQTARRWGWRLLLAHLVLAPLLVVPGDYSLTSRTGDIARELYRVCYPPLAYLLNSHYWQEILLLPIATWVANRYTSLGVLDLAAISDLTVTWLIGAPMYYLIGFVVGLLVERHMRRRSIKVPSGTARDI
jgi:hypothetical protein